MNIKGALVLLRDYCCDKIFLFTDLPSPYVDKRLEDSPMCLMFDASPGTGAAYVKKHFGIEPEITDTRSKHEPQRYD